MAKRKRPKQKKPKSASGKRTKKPRKKRKLPRTIQIVLDHSSLEEIQRAKARTQAELDYQRAYFFELAEQRYAIQDELIQAIAANVTTFKATGWQRAVKWKYSQHPLSALGSMKGESGGRFNHGSLNPLQFPPFPALYLATDRVTAEHELLCQGNKKAGLSNYNFALTNKQSISVVSASFELESVFDLRKARPLMPFVKLIRSFKLSEALILRARSLGIQEPKTVTKASQLKESFLDKDWRMYPMRFDIPANPQIFGQLAHEAGVQGIIYPSKMTKRDALAIFPRNLADSDSFVALDDSPPPSCVIRRLGRGNWAASEIPLDELTALH